MAQKNTTGKLCDNCGKPLEELNQNCSYHHHRIKTSPPPVESPAKSETTGAASENPAPNGIAAAARGDDEVYQGVVEETKPDVSGSDMHDTWSLTSFAIAPRVIAFFKLIADNIEWLDKKLDWLMAPRAQESKKKHGGNVVAKKNSSWKKWAVRIGIMAAFLFVGYSLRSWRDRGSSTTRPTTRKPSIKAIRLLGDQFIRVANPAFVYAEVEGGGDTDKINCVFSSGSNGVRITPEVGPKCTAKIEVGRHQSSIKIDLTATNASGETDTNSANFEVKDKETENVVLFGIDILYPSPPVRRGDRVELIARFLNDVDESDFSCEWACGAGRIVSTGRNTALFYTSNLSNNDYKNGVLIQVTAKNSRGIAVHQKERTIEFRTPRSLKPTPTQSPQPGAGQANPDEKSKSSSQVKPPG